MKHLMLVCLTLCSFLPVLPAQNTDFAPVGAKWYYSQISFDFPYPEEYHLVEVTEEVVFQGKLCRKIEGLTINCGLPNPSYVFNRNDSTFFWSDFTGSFEILYDFGAEPGDTWLIQGLGLFGDSLRVNVEALGQRILGTDTLKSWTISHLGCYDWGNEIIEKLGNLYFLSPSFCLCENGPFNARCYSDSFSEFHLVPYPCDTVFLISGTTDLATNPIHIFPNPTSREVTFTLPDAAEGHWTMTDIAGKDVRNGPWEGSSTHVYLGDLMPGLYIFQLRAKDGLLYVGKIAVNK